MNLTEKQKEQLTAVLQGAVFACLCRGSSASGRKALSEIQEKNSGRKCQTERKTDKTEISPERKRHEEKIPCQKEEKVCSHRYPMIE